MESYGKILWDKGFELSVISCGKLSPLVQTPLCPSVFGHKDAPLLHEQGRRLSQESFMTCFRGGSESPSSNSFFKYTTCQGAIFRGSMSQIPSECLANSFNKYLLSMRAKLSIPYVVMNRAEASLDLTGLLMSSGEDRRSVHD